MWREDYDTWRQRWFDEEGGVYILVDGIYSGLRAEYNQPCTLVVIRVKS